jgi:hypothetical protein
MRRLEPRGILAIKDFTSIISMSGDAREKVLSALREIYDGHWSREMGTDGGKNLTWDGRIAVIGAVTSAWDTAHAVISKMGDRFVLCRIDPRKSRMAAGRKALGNIGSETQMRAELGKAVAGVMAGMNTTPIDLTRTEEERVLAAADLVTLARTNVNVDYSGKPISADAPEMPTRFAKEIGQIIRGSVAVGMDRADAMRLAIRCARDSMPPLRLQLIDAVSQEPGQSTSEIRKAVDKPGTTVDRALVSMHLLGIFTVFEQEYGHSPYGDPKVRWRYSLADDIDPFASTAGTGTTRSVGAVLLTSTITVRYGSGATASGSSCGSPTPSMPTSSPT